MNKETLSFVTPPSAEKLQNFFGVFLQFQIGVDTVWEINTETKKAQVQTKEIVSDGLDVSDLAEAVTQEVMARLPGQRHE